MMAKKTYNARKESKAMSIVKDKLDNKEYQDWLIAVDNWIDTIAGLSRSDLSDYGYRDDFDSGVLAVSTAQFVLVENGFFLALIDDEP